ncbi:hypothetical protein H4219_003449 [Mycoemilia scoparia]|uniref:Bud22 domain-containing protein n=1 Tax=Mycoemilia scoparia TaxID=417184 RepID=A0A9W7ZVG1_9FUNG|nr:hypothetical protein H4219_003449 [Mycoemilia scoparia]
MTGKGPSLARAKRMIEKENRHKKSALKRGDLDAAGVFSETQDPEKLEQQLRELRIKKAQQKLHHIRKQLRKLCKISRVFQVQKVNKRIKSNTAKLGAADESVKKDIEAALKNDIVQVEILKNKADLDRCADEAVNMLIKSNTTIENYIPLKDIPRIGDDINDAVARILDHGPIKTLIKEMSEELVVLLEGKSKKSAEKSESKEKENIDSGISDDDDDDSNEKSKKKKKGLPTVASTDESMFVGSLADFASDNDDSDISISDYDEPKKSSKSSKKRKRSKLDSDDWVDPKFDEIYGIGEKKNRPGQRQRQKMWEKKFGKDANHIKLRRKEKKEKKPLGGGGGDRQINQRTKTMESSQATTVAAGPFKNKLTETTSSSKNIHPSWELKQQQKQKMANAKPQGTKITFDDDVGDNKDNSENSYSRRGSNYNNNTIMPKHHKDSSADTPTNMHPSWAAKVAQRRKLAELQNSSAKKSNKIVFDDSD